VSLRYKAEEWTISSHAVRQNPPGQQTENGKKVISIWGQNPGPESPILQSCQPDHLGWTDNDPNDLDGQEQEEQKRSAKPKQCRKSRHPSAA
jgi:hypothetical protein